MKLFINNIYIISWDKYNQKFTRKFRQICNAKKVKKEVIVNFY